MSAELRQFHKSCSPLMNEVICPAFRIRRADRRGIYLSTVNGIQPTRDACTGSGEGEGVPRVAGSSVESC